MRNRDALPQGWHFLPDEIDTNYWRVFCERFQFRQGVVPADWPGIVEPCPSITWDISTIFLDYDDNRPKYAKMERSLEVALATLLRSVLPQDQMMLALHLNHQGYGFVTHQMDYSLVSSWPLSVAPIGNYHIFALPDFSEGIFGHPWEQSLCFFGKEFVSGSREYLSSILETVAVALRHQRRKW